MTSSTQGQGMEAVHRINGGYLPKSVANALDEALQQSGVDVASFATGQVPSGTFPQITYDDGTGGQRGWRLSVLVERRDIAAGATGSPQEKFMA